MTDLSTAIIILAGAIGSLASAIMATLAYKKSLHNATAIGEVHTQLNGQRSEEEAHRQRLENVITQKNEAEQSRLESVAKAAEIATAAASSTSSAADVIKDAAAAAAIVLNNAATAAAEVLKDATASATAAAANLKEATAAAKGTAELKKDGAT
jgi:hypothetical protein